MGPGAELPNDTWGISGPAFIAGYAALLLPTFGMMLWAQRRIWRSSSPLRIDFEDLDPCEVGLLSSRELAITVAFLELERRGAVALDAPLADHLTAAGYTLATRSRRLRREASEAPLAARIEWVPPHEPRCRTELAIREAFRDLDATRPGERHSPTVVAMRASSLLDRAELALEEKGLRPSSEVAGRLRRTLIWLIPVVVLGIVRLAYGLSRGKPVGFLAFVLALVGAYVLSHWRAGSWIPPAVTGARRRWCAPKAREQRRIQTHAPATGDARPSPIEVAADGTGALWKVAPGLAASLGAPGPATVAGLSGRFTDWARTHPLALSVFARWEGTR